ncbi:MAG: M1 family metallopeptidase, partial [Gemmatimonadota bacterium]
MERQPLPPPVFRLRPSAAALLVALFWGPAHLGLGPSTLAAQDPGARTWPRPLELPAAFEAAVAAGTRSLDGTPGPAYWQQRADYVIRAELDPAAGVLRGSETITYHNRSPDTLASVVLRLEQNVYAEGARRNRRVRPTGGITVENLRVGDAPAEIEHPGSGYYRSLTLGSVALPAPLPPGDVVRISLDFRFTVPRAPTFRQGNVDGELFGVAQWYPRVAVYDDVYGWDRTPYLGDGEFYLEYGDFDVHITVPGGWIVGATGVLRNAGDVLSDAARGRLEGALPSDEVVRVVDAADGTAPSTRPGDRLTWHFTASDVRDFAFATSADYAWDARGVEVRGPDGGEGGRVLAQAFYRPELTAWRERGVEFVAHTLESLSAWIGRYPYPQLSIAEGPTGGMEYPMFIFNPSTNSERGLAGVTIHEGAHQWFPMVVGTMEAKHAWMDEGIVSYWDAMSAAALWDEAPPRWGETGSYLRVAGTESEVPLMRHTDLVSPYGARGMAAYTKPAVVLGALRAVVGDSVFLAAFRDVYRSWGFRHPQPW